MASPLVSRAAAGLRPPARVTAAALHQDTAHWGGPSPWTGGGIDRSSAARFAATTDHARCATIWRAWQAFHMGPERGWSDIAYSSGVCPHGWRYEGRGPRVRTAANGTNPGNSNSHATCYIGGQGDPLTDQAKRAFRDESARLAGLDRVHSDWKQTDCPGDALRRWVHAGMPVPAPPPKPPTPPPVEDDMPPIIARKTDGTAWLVTPGFRQRVSGQTDFNLARLIHGARIDEQTGNAFTNLPDAWIDDHVDVATLPAIAKAVGAVSAAVKELDDDIPEGTG